MKALRFIVLVSTLAACDTGGLLIVTSHDGGGGNGGAPPDDGGPCIKVTCDAGLCHPRQDNDPALCAGKCATVDNGCGNGVIYCDTVCPSSTVSAPATCGYAMGNEPACDPCVPDPAIACPTNAPNGFACKWHPIQAPCLDMGKVGDIYQGCCS